MRRLSTAVALGAIVASSAIFRAVLAARSHTPKVLGDELIYSGLAKGWAFHGRPLVRGVSDVGHSTLYALLAAPVFRLTADGASALAALRTIDAVVMALTAVPAYFLARRVVPRNWALGVAFLSVLAPWTAYSALVMTESLFYPVFVTFAAVLVWTLERPTVPRQAALLAMLALVVGVRAQGLSVALGMIAAVVLSGAIERTLAGTVRRFAPTFGVLGVALALALAAKAAGVAIPTSSYDAVFGSLGRIVGLVEWAARNLGSLELSYGIVALAALPVAVRGMLRAGELATRTTGIVTVSLGAGLLASVALLSASPYGLGITHERNLFYLTPLVLTCVAHWLRGGLERPRWLAALSAAIVVACAASLPHSLASTPNNVDAFSAVLFQSLVAHIGVGSFRVWTVLAAAGGAAIFLFSRRPLLPILTVMIAFMALVVRLDYSDSLTGTQASDLAWVDSALPSGSNAALVYLGLPDTGAPCSQVATAEQQDFTNWTEFLNDRVDTVLHIYNPNGRDGLASPELTVGKGGVILDAGTPYAPAYVVIDSRQRVVGDVLARFDLESLHDDALQNGASLTLWRVHPPLRFLPRPAIPSARSDGRDC